MANLFREKLIGLYIELLRCDIAVHLDSCLWPPVACKSNISSSLFGPREMSGSLANAHATVSNGWSLMAVWCWAGGCAVVLLCFITINDCLRTYKTTLWEGWDTKRVKLQVWELNMSWHSHKLIKTEGICRFSGWFSTFIHMFDLFHKCVHIFFCYILGT